MNSNLLKKSEPANFFGANATGVRYREYLKMIVRSYNIELFIAILTGTCFSFGILVFSGSTHNSSRGICVFAMFSARTKPERAVSAQVKKSRFLPA